MIFKDNRASSFTCGYFNVLQSTSSPKPVRPRCMRYIRNLNKSLKIKFIERKLEAVKESSREKILQWNWNPATQSPTPAGMRNLFNFKLNSIKAKLKQTTTVANYRPAIHMSVNSTSASEPTLSPPGSEQKGIKAIFTSKFKTFDVVLNT